MELPGQKVCLGASQRWQSLADRWGSVWTKAFQTPETRMEAQARGTCLTSCIRWTGHTF